MVSQKVGSIYEVGLNDVGYMLADNPQRPVRRQTGVLDTQPPGSDDPLSERIGRYDFIGQSDFTGGEGQTLADRPRSDVTRFFYSEGIDPFAASTVHTPGEITCLPTVSSLLSDTYTNLEMVVIGTDLLVRTADAEYTEIASDGTTTPVATTITSTTSKMSFATDGTNWYLTNGSVVHQGTTGAAGALWSSGEDDVTRIAWCTDRLMGIDGAANPEEIISFSPTGTGTVATTARAGYTCEGLTGGDGYVWFSASSGNDGYIGYWQVDSDPNNSGVALTLPPGEHAVSLYFYLGNVFAGVLANNGTDYEAKVYRCVPSDGILTPQLVVDSLDPFTHPRFAGRDRFVAFTTRNVQRTGEEGIIVIDLESGGYARWHVVTGAAASFDQMYVVNWLGDFAISLDTEGVWGRDTGDIATPSYATGFLETSAGDLGTPALKHLDEVTVTTRPIPTSTSVAVAYSTDLGNNYTAVATYNTVLGTRFATQLSTAVTFPSVRFRLTLTPSGTGRPSVVNFLAKTHATGIVDEIIELPILLDDYPADVTGAALAEDSGPNRGMTRLRTLQNLIGTKTTFQDVDWKMTNTTSLVEVVGVESTSVNVYNQNRGLSDVTSHVAVVTLRRPFTA